MNSIVIGVDPVIVHLGAFELRWYGLMIMVAVIAGIWVATVLGKRRGISSDDIYSVGLWGVIGGIVGARLFHVLDKFEYYMANPLQIFALQQGGLAIWGGVVGGVLAGFLYARYKKLPIAATLDVGAFGLLTGQILGRVGCIINGDVAGAPTNLPWGFVYTHPSALLPQAVVDFALEQGRSVSEIATHPYPAYEMIWNLATFGLLWKLRTRTRIDGVIFVAYVTIYSFGRFLLSFVRMEDQIFLGLQQAQLVALAGALVGAAILIYMIKGKARVAAQGPAVP